MRLRRIEPVLRRALRGPCALPPGSTVLVALSGGADSTALLLGLHRIAPEFRLAIRAAHLHHGLRADEADRDLAFTAGLCERLGIPLIAARWDTRARMRRRGLAGQAGLRTLRREFLRAAARRCGAAAIATAHHADDQLETILLRLLRGAGLPGLGGMRPRLGTWIKPLLEATRHDIEADLRAVGQSWREDRSNQDLAYARNRVRHMAVPALLRALGAAPERPRDRAALARRVSRAAAEAREASRALDRWAARVLSRCCRIEAGVMRLDSQALASYPRGLRLAVLRSAWKRLDRSGNGLTHSHLAAMDRLVRGARGGARVELPGGLRAERDGRQVVIGGPLAPGRRKAIRLRVPGKVSCGGYVIRGDWRSGQSTRRGLPRKPVDVEYFSAEGLRGGVVVRAARADERFVPFGRRHPIRISRFMSQQGVSREQRSRPPVLADAGGVLWVVGVRRSARAPVTADTRRVLRVQAESHD